MVPVKGSAGAKSRLGDLPDTFPARGELAEAFALDTVTALLGRRHGAACARCDRRPRRRRTTRGAGRPDRARGAALRTSGPSLISRLSLLSLLLGCPGCPRYPGRCRRGARRLERGTTRPAQRGDQPGSELLTRTIRCATWLCSRETCPPSPWRTSRRPSPTASAHDRAMVADEEGTGTTTLLARAGIALTPRFGLGSRAAHEAARPRAARPARHGVDPPGRRHRRQPRRGAAPRCRGAHQRPDRPLAAGWPGDGRRAAARLSTSQ